jgi:hypothetical protein
MLLSVKPKVAWVASGSCGVRVDVGVGVGVGDIIDVGGVHQARRNIVYQD